MANQHINSFLDSMSVSRNIFDNKIMFIWFHGLEVTSNGINKTGFQLLNFCVKAFYQKSK